MPSNLQKIEDSKKRKIEFYKYIADIVALTHAPLTCFFAARLLLRDPKVHNELHGEEYTWNLAVSFNTLFFTPFLTKNSLPRLISLLMESLDISRNMRQWISLFTTYSVLVSVEWSCSLEGMVTCCWTCCSGEKLLIHCWAHSRFLNTEEPSKNTSFQSNCCSLLASSPSDAQWLPNPSLTSRWANPASFSSSVQHSSPSRATSGSTWCSISSESYPSK